MSAEDVKTQDDVVSSQDLVAEYNYDDFVPGKFDRFMNFAGSPPLGQPAPDFPLWRLEDRGETALSEIWGQHALTVVEFGSFT